MRGILEEVIDGLGNDGSLGLRQVSRGRSQQD